MQQEISEIKETKKAERRFQNTNTKVSNCIFIRTTLPDPCELAHRIFSDLATSRQQKTRSAIRLLPIANSCKAFEKDIKKMAEEMFVKYFETPYGSGLNYTTVFKTRNNSSLSRETSFHRLVRSSKIWIRFTGSITILRTMLCWWKSWEIFVAWVLLRTSSSLGSTICMKWWKTERSKLWFIQIQGNRTRLSTERSECRGN